MSYIQKQKEQQKLHQNEQVDQTDYSTDRLLDPRHQQQRSEEIQDICEGLQGLHDVTLDLQTLVIDQRILVERIDVNIDDTIANVAKGTENVKEAKEKEDCCFKVRKSMFFGSVIMIIILSILLIIKFLLFRRQ